MLLGWVALKASAWSYSLEFPLPGARARPLEPHTQPGLNSPLPGRELPTFPGCWGRGSRAFCCPGRRGVTFRCGSRLHCLGLLMERRETLGSQVAVLHPALHVEDP